MMVSAPHQRGGIDTAGLKQVSHGLSAETIFSVVSGF